MLRVLLVGGYGNFGAYVARALAPDPNIQLIISGRNAQKAETAAKELHAANPAQGAFYDMHGPVEAMAELSPGLVINMVGPYHTQNYAVAEAAVACGAHYCDIADAREFVCGIGVLDEAARAAGVTVLAGASSVPSLTAAYCDTALEEMAELHAIEYGISGAEQANRGAGTVAAVLSYVGQRFTRLQNGEMKDTVGWRHLKSIEIPELGKRFFSEGNVPDLGLFPARYRGLKDQSFWAGHEISLLHLGTWLCGKLVRLRLLPRLDRFASELVRFSSLFNWLGKSESAFYLFVSGVDSMGAAVEKKHWIVARQGHGPILPCIPVILLARKLARGQFIEAGARPCLDVITLDEYRAEFAGLDVICIDQ